MTLINVGINFEVAKQMSEKERLPAPIGPYKLQCTQVATEDDNGNAITTKNGRPQRIWHFEIVGASDPNLNGKKLRHFVVLPTTSDPSGCGFLVDVTSALGKPWSGQGVETNDYVGKTCMANLGHSKDGRFNNIDSFISA